MEKLVYGNDRILSSRISYHDLIHCIACRVKHVEEGAPIYVDIDGKIEDIALEEIKRKQCPLSVKRKLSSKDGIDYYEVWAVNELTVDFSRLVL